MRILFKDLDSTMLIYIIIIVNCYDDEFFSVFYIKKNYYIPFTLFLIF